MSLLVTVYTSTGIVMASDSRTTLTTSENRGSKVVESSIELSDSTDKTFLFVNKCGVSFCGSADINRIPLSTHLEYFEKEKITPKTTIIEMPELLLEYVNSVVDKDESINITFIIAGYYAKKGKAERYVFTLDIDDDGYNIIEQVEGYNSGAIWRGETEVFSRLRQSVIIYPNFVYEGEVSYKDQAGKKKIVSNGAIVDMDHKRVTYAYEIDYSYMSIQDAVNFCKYAIETTINTMKYASIEKTVGGPIDILVIKPYESFWACKKELKV